MKTYSLLLKQLEEKDIPIKTSNYDEHLMGSWVIEIASTPVYRIVHDGRDKTIVLETLDKNSDWTSLLADKTKTGKHILKELTTKLSSL